MDWKEALEGLRELIDPLCTDDQFDYEKEIEKAIQAVEKQIPKKPLPLDEFHAFFGCPSCKRIVGTVQDYCEHCGQRIDWSD